jgi:hypothetical protein
VARREPGAWFGVWHGPELQRHPRLGPSHRAHVPAGSAPRFAQALPLPVVGFGCLRWHRHGLVPLAHSPLSDKHRLLDNAIMPWGIPCVHRVQISCLGTASDRVPASRARDNTEVPGSRCYTVAAGWIVSRRTCLILPDEVAAADGMGLSAGLRQARTPRPL